MTFITYKITGILQKKQFHVNEMTTGPHILSWWFMQLWKKCMESAIFNQRKSESASCIVGAIPGRLTSWYRHDAVASHLPYSHSRVHPSMALPPRWQTKAPFQDFGLDTVSFSWRKPPPGYYPPDCPHLSCPSAVLWSPRLSWRYSIVDAWRSVKYVTRHFRSWLVLWLSVRGSRCRACKLITPDWLRQPRFPSYGISVVELRFV